MNTFVRKSIALLLLGAVAACSGGSGAGSTVAGSNPMPATRQMALRSNAVDPMFTNIVGVGDSLTAGYQSGGFLGALGVPNPEFTGQFIPPGQESGFWADLDEQAGGFPPQKMYDPSVSPLPLIAGPGLDNQVVESATTVIGTSKSGNPCEFDNGFDQSAFALSGLQRVRMNPDSSNIRDLGVPGITLHEAAHMNQPLTPTCNALPGTAGLLSAVTNGESGVFYPVLGNYSARLHQNLNMVAAAHIAQPTFATVWLGANDVLKFMGSGGQFRGGDMTAAQTQADLGPIVRGFVNNHVGVAVANLPDVLLTPYFMNVDIPSNPAACKIDQYFYCLLLEFGQPAGTAAAITKAVRAAYHLEPTGKCVPTSLTAPCGYVTLQGALAIVASLLTTGKIPNLDPDGPGTGLGSHYITPGLAGAIQAINDNINTGIANTAAQNHVAMVDVKSIFEGIATGNPANPYFQLAQVNPGICCTLVFLGGLVSFDGLHPSNTGYALISYAFIASINKRYGTHIPQVPIESIYSGKPPYKFADPYAPQIVHDLRFVRSGNKVTIQYATPRLY
jgi:lysophospholipase L1-like esterase